MMLYDMGRVVSKRKIYDKWRKTEFAQHPYIPGKLPDYILDHKEELLNGSKQFKHLVFKNDYFENHLPRLRKNIIGKYYVIYCVRYPLVELYEAHIRWIGREDFKTKVFVESFKKSVEDIYFLKEKKVNVIPVSISWEHSKIRNKFQDIIYSQLKLGQSGLQKKFTQERHRLAVNISQRERQGTNEELMEELLSVAPDLPEWEERYIKLVS